MQVTSGREKLKSLLLDELASRQSKNAAYSLRAFARDIGVNVTSLSEFFADKRTLSKRAIERVADRLQLSPLTLEASSSRRSPQVVLEDESFQVLADWHHYAILNLARLPRNKAEPAWIAERLGITPVMARSARDRLVRLGYLRLERGRMMRITPNLTTRNDRISTALRRYHKQNLELARQAMEMEPKERRFLTSITMPTNPGKYAKATELILRFRDELSHLLEEGATSEVYTLAIQLFPLTKRRSDA